MRVSEIRDLIRLKPVELDATRRRLSACHDVADLRAVGRRLIPRPVFDYVDGGSDEELSLRANVRAYQRFRFQPRTLVNVSQPDTSARFLGSVVPLPLALAPTGYTRMMHPAGEIAAARAAQRHGLPYTLSTVATTTIEAVAEAAQPDLWFQLYILRDSRADQGAGRPGGRGQVPGAGGDGRHLRDRPPDPGPPQRAGHPARADAEHAGQHRGQAGLLDPDAAQPGHRLRQLRRARGADHRGHRQTVQPGHHLG